MKAMRGRNSQNWAQLHNFIKLLRALSPSEVEQWLNGLLTKPRTKGLMGNVMVALIQAVFNTDGWNVRGNPETLMNSWALPPWLTVSVLSTVFRLPCWSRHCCFLYWPLLWTAFFPQSCCRPGCLGQSSETPVVLDRGERMGRGNEAVKETV